MKIFRMILFAILCAAVLVAAWSCSSTKSEYYRPIVDFTADTTIGAPGLTVQFTDQTLNEPFSWVWEFGDGGTSSLQNPQHTYDDAGFYSVTLTAINSDGADTLSKADYIKIYENVVADFLPSSPLTGAPGLTVNFTNNSVGATSYFWDFGSAGQSNEENPSITFNQAGSYGVKLVAEGPIGKDSLTRGDLIIISDCYGVADPTANFSPKSSSIYLGESVSFTDQSSAASGHSIVSREWSFGDGTSPSSATNPSHTYNKCGTFTTRLTVTDDCSNSDTETGSVSVSARTKTKTISGRVLDPVYPRHTGSGDYEFNGHGPNVEITVSLFTQNNDATLYARVYMHAKETVSDWTEGVHTQDFYLGAADSGYRFYNLPSGCSQSYTDSDHGPVSGSCSWASWQSWGDTDGDDICDNPPGCHSDDTKVIVTIKTFNVSQIQICP